jgi:hypothetical protein
MGAGSRIENGYRIRCLLRHRAVRELGGLGWSAGCADYGCAESADCADLREMAA